MILQDYNLTIFTIYEFTLHKDNSLSLQLLDNTTYLPFPQRSDLMSMSTIANKNKRWSRTHSDALRTEDIPGAQPAILKKYFIEKPAYNFASPVAQPVNRRSKKFDHL